MEKIITTNCWVYKDSKLLLGLKKRGFAEGRWNGFGGKLEHGESLEAAAHRELLEECGIVATHMELAGTIEFEYQGKDKIMEVNIFRITEFTGEPKESEEMKPQWWPINALPFKNMWPDDPYWLPLFLSGKKFSGKFVYTGYDTIISHTLKEL